MKLEQLKGLRIGNLLNSGKGVYRVIGIFKSEIICETMDGAVIQSAIYKPIPITEDWLINNFNFNKDYKKGWIGIDVISDSGMTTDFVLAEPFSMGEWQEQYCFVYDSFRFVVLDYIHELQNLFFSITKKELEYK